MYFVDCTLINLANESWAVVINVVGLIILFIFRKNWVKGLENVYRDMWILAACNLGATFSDALTYVFELVKVPYVHQLMFFFCTLVYFFDDFFMVVVTIYIYDSMHESVKGKTVFRVVWVSYLFCLGMLISNFFTGRLFFIDADGFYQRGSLFALNQIFGLVTGLLDFILVVMNRRRISKINKITFYIYCIIPPLGLIVQFIWDGIAVFLPAITISLLVMLVGLVYYNSKLMHYQSQELQEQSIKGMISQLQPHFLYNSITSIMGIEGNPSETKKALANFGKYLRTNLDVMRDFSPVSFEKELKHVEAYVSLEKLRFEDKLQVNYNIQTTGFRVPVLCVQMMVENAIKHGITKKKGKGTVTVTSREMKDHFEVIIEDDGVGFDPSEKKEDGRSHVGLESTIKRIKHFGGTVEIESEIGFGTTIKIIIPKE